MNRGSIPNNYIKTITIDLTKDKKTALKISISTLIVVVVMIFLGSQYKPFFSSFRIRDIVLLIIAFVIYATLHELTHGLFMNIFSKTRSHYGFGGSFFYAKSNGLFDKKSYVVILLSPVIWLGTVLIVLNILFPEYFWVIFMVQIGNIAGSITDIGIILSIKNIPSSALIQDDGVSINIFDERN